MVRDLAERDQAARAMSLMMACSRLAPMLAPLIGGQILWFLRLARDFWVLAAIGVVRLDRGLFPLPETLRPEYRQPLPLGSVLQALRRAGAPPRLHGLRLTGAFQFRR